MQTPTHAGWFDDPEDADQLRYFDGVVWTKHTTPRSTRRAASTPVQPGQQQFPGQGHPPQYPGQGGPQVQPEAQGQVPGQVQGQPPTTGGWPAPSYGGAQRVATTPDGQPLASYWHRVGAFIIDGIIQFVLMLVLGGW